MMSKHATIPNQVVVNPVTLIEVGSGIKMPGSAEDCPRVCIFLNTNELGTLGIEVDQPWIDVLRGAIKAAEDALAEVQRHRRLKD